MSRPPSTVTIGLVSDTHGWLHPGLLQHFEGCKRIIHAGDIGKIEVIDQLEEVAPVTAVKGNIDGGDLRFFPLSACVEEAGKRISVLHIAGNPKRPRKAALDVIREDRPDVIVVGHSHIWVVGRVRGVLWLNPGAAGNHGFHDVRTAALLHIQPDGELSLDRIVLGPRGKF